MGVPLPIYWLLKKDQRSFRKIAAALGSPNGSRSKATSLWGNAAHHWQGASVEDQSPTGRFRPRGWRKVAWKTLEYVTSGICDFIWYQVQMWYHVFLCWVFNFNHPHSDLYEVSYAQNQWVPSGNQHSYGKSPFMVDLPIKISKKCVFFSMVTYILVYQR